MIYKGGNNVIDGRYQGEIQTPMGILRGTIELATKEGRVQGYLEAMGTKNPFEKVIVTNKQCQFSGKIPYFLGTIMYEAKVEMQEKGFQGMVMTNLGQFKMIAKKISE